MNIILLGGPGAGKGTQANCLINDYKMLHISTGDLLREAVSEGTEQGKLAKKYMEAGNLVPDEVIIGITKDKLESSDISHGLILDGFPRTVEQAKSLDEMFKELNLKLDAAVLIDTPDKAVIDRICTRRTCGDCGYIGSVLGLTEEEINNYKCPECGGKMTQRKDDNEETVRNRLEVYHSQTAPLIDFYSDKGILYKVDGATSPDGVYQQIKKIMK